MNARLRAFSQCWLWRYIGLIAGIGACPRVVGADSISAPGTPIFVQPLSIRYSIDAIKVGPGGKIFVAAIDEVTRTWGIRMRSDGSRDGSYHPAPEITGSDEWNVFSLGWQSDEKLLIAGRLTSRESVTRHGILRLKPDGSLDETFRFDVDAQSYVEAVQPLADGRLLVVGKFTQTGVGRESRVARLNQDGSLDATFHSPDVDYTTSILSLGKNGSFWIGGQFRRVNGQSRFGIAHILSDGELDPTFVPAVAIEDGAQFPLLNWLAPLPNGSLLVCGEFDKVAGQPRQNVARLAPDGQLDPTFNAGAMEGPDFFNVDFAHQERGGKILVAGGFTRIAGQPRHRIARLNNDGSLDQGYAVDLPPTFGDISAFEVMEDDTLIVASSQAIARLRTGEAGESPPRITRQPVGTSIPAGQPVTFEVTAASTSMLRFQWYRNGAALPGETNSTLTYARPTSSQAGPYYVTISNDAGSVTSELAVLHVNAQPSLPGSLDLDFPSGVGPNGPVLAILETGDGRLLVGGEFKAVNGIRRPGIARLDQSGRVDNQFAPTGTVTRINTMLVDPSGRVLVGGSFSRIESGIGSNIGRLGADGKTDYSFQSGNGASGPVLALARQRDGKFLVGGSFETYAGEPRARLVRLDAKGIIDPTFQVSPPPDGGVTCIAVQSDGCIVIGGDFATIGGSARGGLARLLPDGHLDPMFNPGWGVSNPESVRSLIPTPEGTLLVGIGLKDNYGNPVWFNDIGCGGVVRLDAFGGMDAGFSATLMNEFYPYAGNVVSLAMGSNGAIYVAGRLPYRGGLNQFVNRLTSQGSLDSTFGQNRLSGDGNATAVVVLAGGDIVVGLDGEGDASGMYLRRIRGGPSPANPPVYRSRVPNVALTPRKGSVPFAPSSWKIRKGEEAAFHAGAMSPGPIQFQWQIDGVNVPGATNAVFRMPVLDSNSRFRVEVLQENSSGTARTGTWITVPDEDVYAGQPDPAFRVPAPINGRLFRVRPLADGGAVIGGSLLTVAGKPSPLIARLDSHGALLPFETGWSVGDGTVREILVEPDGHLLVGGGFRTVGVDGSTSSSLVRLHSSGKPDTNFRPVFSSNAAIFAIARHLDGRIAVGGTFNSVNGDVRSNLVVLDAQGQIDSHFRPQIDGTVNACLWATNRLLIAGAFGVVNGEVRKGIAQLMPDGSLDPTFVPIEYPDKAVQCLALQRNGRILIGGQFTSIGTKPNRLIARLLANGQLDTGFSSSLSGIVINSMALQSDGAIVVTGNLTAFGTPGIARLLPNGSIDYWFDSGTGLIRPDGEGVGFCVDLDVHGDVLVAGLFSHVNGLNRSRVARLFGRDPEPELPTFTGIGWDRTVRVGRSVIMTAGIQSEFPQEWEWQQTGRTNSVLTRGTERSLRIQGAKASDAGSYSLTASSGLGKVTSEPIQLIVNPAAMTAGLPDPNSFSGRGVDGTVTSVLRLPDGQWVIGGEFSNVHGQPRAVLARLGINGELDADFDVGPGVTGRVCALLLEGDGSLLVGGTLVREDGYTAALVRVTSDGAIQWEYGPRFEFGAEVRSMARLSDGSVIIGGRFRRHDQPSVVNVSKLRQDGSLDASFVLSLNGTVEIVAARADDTILIGGAFNQVDGEPVNGLVRVRSNGHRDETFAGPTSGTWMVNAVVSRADGSYLLGGRFTGLPGIPSAALLSMDGSGRILESLDTIRTDGTAGEVLCMSQDDRGGLIFAGAFDAVKASLPDGRWLARASLARVDATWHIDPTFDPGIGPEGFGDDAVIRSLASEPDGTLIVGGGFRLIDGYERGGVARLFGTNLAASVEDQPPRFVNSSIQYFWVEGTTKSVTNTVVDPDTPADKLTFSLEGPIPQGLQFNSKNGALTWTPSEELGPGTYVIVLRVTDSSIPPLSGLATNWLVISEANTPPSIAAIPTQKAKPGQQFEVPVRFEDSDLPASPLNLWLGRGAPPGSYLDSDGSFVWEVPANQTPGEVSIELVASDGRSDGITRYSFRVQVENSAIEFVKVILVAPGVLRLGWLSVLGTNYRVQYSDSLAADDWHDLHEMVMGNGLERSVDLPIDEQPQRFFRLSTVP